MAFLWSLVRVKMYRMWAVTFHISLVKIIQLFGMVLWTMLKKKFNNFFIYWMCISFAFDNRICFEKLGLLLIAIETIKPDGEKMWVVCHWSKYFPNFQLSYMFANSYHWKKRLPDIKIWLLVYTCIQNILFFASDNLRKRFN